MSILLLILKVVGWILLGIVIFIFIGLTLVLCLHAGYKGQFEATEDLSESKFFFRANWLFYIFQFYYIFENGKQEYFLRIFGKKVLIPKEKKEKNKKKSSHRVGEKNKSNEKKKVSLKERLLGIKKTITDKNNHRAFLIFINELKYLCKHWGPRKFKADVTFSMGDPANTGILLGIISVFPVAYKKDIVLKADFESDKMYLQGHAMLKGRIRLIHLVKIIFTMFFKDETRSIILKFSKS